MEATVDLNNEKVLMRKEIKRAKGWAISKVVRCIQNLRRRKGSEAQVAQNERRAARLVQELDVIKDLKPDHVFKELLNCKLCIQDLMKSDYPMQQRAIVRIGSAHFVQKRMQEIRESISAFQNVRNGKSLQDQNPAVCGDADTTAPSADTNAQNRLDDTNVETPVILGEELNSADGKAVVCQKEKFERTESELVEIDSVPARTKASKAQSNTHQHESEEIKSRESISTGFDSSSADEGAEGSPIAEKDAANSQIEEVIIGKQDDYSIVIPSMYSKEKKDDPARSNFNDIAKAEGADDVTELLPNIGADFDSEKEDDSLSSDIELGELTNMRKNQAIRKDGENSSISEDVFFLDKGGQSNRRFVQTKAKTMETLSEEEQHISEVKSCFMESLASVSHQRTKGKNRMSQRARKTLARKQPRENGNTARFGQRTETAAGKDKNRGRKVPVPVDEPKPLHPSWEASRKRKEAQNNKQEFQGKRVCFDDSD